MADGGELDAGAVVVAFKATMAELDAVAKKAEGALQNFATTAVQQNKKVETSNVATAKSTEQLGDSSAKQAKKFAALSARLIGLQAVVQSFGQAGDRAGGKIQKGFQTAQVALTSFVATVAFLPGPIGIALGAVAALSAVINQLIQQAEEAERKLTPAEERVFDAVIEIGNLRKEAEKLEKVVSLLTTSSAEQAQRRLDLFIQQGVKLGEMIPQLTQDMRDLLARVNIPGGPGILQDLFSEGKLDTLRKHIEALRARNVQTQEFIKQGNTLFTEADLIPDSLINDLLKTLKTLVETKKTVDGLTESVATLRAEVGGKGVAEEVQKLNRGFDDLLASLKEKKELGLVEPLEELALVAESARKRLEALVELERTLERLKLIPGVDEKTAKAIDDQIKALRGTTLGPAKEAFQKAGAQVDFQKTFAEPFASATFSGLARGIADAREPMELLADFGAGLFENMVFSFAKTLEKHTIEALVKAAGAGGAVLGSVLTGVFGIIGLFLSRGKGGSSVSFDDTKGVIESTQAVRGIVAGPTSVAIAAVGEDLRRANAGVEDRLDALIGIGTRVLSKMTQTAGAAAPAGSSIAGTVPSA